MEKKKMSEHQKKVEELLGKIVNQTKPQKTASEETPQTKEGHKTLVEQMLCKDCNPPEDYKKAHLDLMGKKECKDCGNVDRKKEEECSECGEEYPKAET